MLRYCLFTFVAILVSWPIADRAFEQKARAATTERTSNSDSQYQSPSLLPRFTPDDEHLTPEVASKMLPLPTLAQLQKAAEQGDAEAQYNVGDYYKNGWAVTQDYAEAMKWFQLAADGGYISIVRLKELQRDMSPAQIEEGQNRALEWKLKNRGEK